MDQLFDLFAFRVILKHIRSDNGSEFMAKAIIKWLNHFDINTLFIEPRNPRDDEYIKSFNSKL